jgi:hypothetical protein
MRGEISNEVLEKIKNDSIIIAGLARNSSNVIEKQIKVAQKLGRFFKEYKIVIFENDSEDGTREIIKKLSKEDENIHLINCDPYSHDCKLNESILYDMGCFSRYRIDKMATFRNKYMDYIEEHFSDYQYLLVQDFDIEGVLNIPDILNVLNSSEDELGNDKLPSEEWSALAFNGRSPLPSSLGSITMMYDAMAYCRTKEDLIQSKNKNDGILDLSFKVLDGLRINFTDKPLKVYSAFNGACLYKLKDVVDKRYQLGWSCEHNSLHSQLIDEGKNIFIHPDLKIYVGFQGPRDKFLQF